MTDLVLKYYFMIFCSFTLCQISNPSTPKSFSVEISESINTFMTDDIDIESLLKQDAQDLKLGHPFRFGFSFDVDIDFFDIAIPAFDERGVLLLGDAPSQDLGIPHKSEDKDWSTEYLDL